MLTLVPAGRTNIDRRRDARGMLKPAHPIVQPLPGIERLAGLLGRSVTRWPAPYILAVLAVTVGLGLATPGLKSEFSIRDVLPRGGTVLADMDTLEAAVGGSSEATNVLIKAEATETRTLLNVRDFTTAFQDATRRPPTAAGPIQTSYELLLRDWTTDRRGARRQVRPRTRGALDRDRRGLHHPCDSSLPGRVRPPAQPGGSGSPHARDHWVGAVGLCTDDRARAGSAGGLAVGCCPTPSGEPRPLSPLSAPLCPPSLLLASRLQQ